MLYLVPKTPRPTQPDITSQQTASIQHNTLSFKNRFISDVQERSLNLFSFYAQDARYDLRWSMFLSIQNVMTTHDQDYGHEEFLIPMIVGDFPNIDDELLLDKAFGNEYIQGILMRRFYLNILESLLLFCEEVNAGGLILTFNEYNINLIDFYRDFIVSESKIVSDKGEQTQIVINADGQTYHALTDYIEKINNDFRKTLWRKQWGNPTIKQYLKTYALTDF